VRRRRAGRGWVRAEGSHPTGRRRVRVGGHAPFPRGGPPYTFRTGTPPTPPGVTLAPPQLRSPTFPPAGAPRAVGPRAHAARLSSASRCRALAAASCAGVSFTRGGGIAAAPFSPACPATPSSAIHPVRPSPTTTSSQLLVCGGGGPRGASSNPGLPGPRGASKSGTPSTAACMGARAARGAGTTAVARRGCSSSASAMSSSVAQGGRTIGAARSPGPASLRPDRRVSPAGLGLRRLPTSKPELASSASSSACSDAPLSTIARGAGARPRGTGSGEVMFDHAPALFAARSQIAAWGPTCTYIVSGCSSGAARAPPAFEMRVHA